MSPVQSTIQHGHFILPLRTHFVNTNFHISCDFSIISPFIFRIYTKKHNSDFDKFSIRMGKKVRIPMFPALSASLFLPFFGTALGSASVFMLRKPAKRGLQNALSGFSGGVMCAASVWSLLIPAMESVSHWNRLAFVPATFGVWLGIVFLAALDFLIPRLSEKSPVSATSAQSTSMLILAVTLHNIPEGMAVGIVCAGYLSGSAHIRLTEVIVLALGIVIQNCPEGAVVSLPLRAAGLSPGKAFLGGILSAVAELLGALLTVLAAEQFLSAMPILLGFAAGAMLYVVAGELLPAAARKDGFPVGTLFFMIGFTLMMALDTAFG